MTDGAIEQWEHSGGGAIGLRWLRARSTSGRIAYIRLADIAAVLGGEKQCDVVLRSNASVRLDVPSRDLLAAMGVKQLEAT